jgi:hypothetical protein
MSVVFAASDAWAAAGFPVEASSPLADACFWTVFVSFDARAVLFLRVSTLLDASSFGCGIGMTFS